MLIETASGSSITRPVFVVGYRPTCAFGALRGRILVDADRSRRSEKRVSIKFALFEAHVYNAIRRLPESRWNPQAGDLIVSNWSSWIEVLWLAYK
jgi:hypothetical protein